MMKLYEYMHTKGSRWRFVEPKLYNVHVYVLGKGLLANEGKMVGF